VFLTVALVERTAKLLDDPIQFFWISLLTGSSGEVKPVSF
jgi:hypothetical protein